MMMRDDKFNSDGTVTVPIDCYMKMSRLDYLFWKYLRLLKEDEKEKLLLEGIPHATSGRLDFSEEYNEIKNFHTQRLKNFKIFVK